MQSKELIRAKHAHPSKSGWIQRMANLSALAKTARTAAVSVLAVGLMVLQPTVANATPEEIVAITVYEKDKTLYRATSKTLASSSNAGKTWDPIKVPALKKGGAIAAFAVSTKNKDVFYLAAPGGGVMRSTDGGRSWSKQVKGLPKQSVSLLTTHSDQADTVYAYIPGDGIYRSQDRGTSWRKTDSGPRQTLRAFVHTDMPGSMETGWLFAASSDAVRRSMDCFCGWHEAGELSGEMTAITYDPDEPMRVYAAGKPGLFVSEDGGETWTGLKAPAGKVSALLAVPGSALYLASEEVLYRSNDRGKTWEKA